MSLALAVCYLILALFYSIRPLIILRLLVEDLVIVGMIGMVEFNERVYSLCKLIPKGKVSTYGEISRVLGSSPRAVGQALRCNPFAPIVPCHRVVKSNGALGGFMGETVG